MERPIHVLVVDDDPLMRSLLTALIRQHDFKVTHAADGAAALGIIQGGEVVDLIISDWEMPGVTGVELCRAVRQMHLPYYIHFILLTARQQQDDFTAAMDAGADDFLLKPISPPILKARLEVVKRLLGLHYRLERKNRLLTDANDQLRVAYAKLEKDMEAAAVAQRCLLPEAYKEVGCLRFASCLLPSAMVSGDMYNYIELPDGSVAFYMVDVAGHGARAALMSVTLNHLLDMSAFLPGGRGGPPRPDLVVADLNRRFTRADSETIDYFTMVCGVVNPQGDSMTFCQAGHPCPILVQPGRPAGAIGDGGFPVGLMAHDDYTSVTVPLSPGSRVILHSDGMTECASPDGVHFGQERLQALFEQARDWPLNSLEPALYKTLTTWQGGQRFEDDVSVLAFEVVTRH